jgi:hypothetical protein
MRFDPEGLPQLTLKTDQHQQDLERKSTHTAYEKNEFLTGGADRSII